MPSAHYSQPPAKFEQGSSGDAWFIGRNTISAQLQAHLVEELNINPLYTKEHTKGGLQFAWGHYLECSQAIKHAKTISEAGNLPTDIPPFTEYLIVNIFIGKTTHGTVASKTAPMFACSSKILSFNEWINF